MKSPQRGALKRFYKSAGIAERGDGTFAILLDGRQVKTPAGKPLCPPAQRLAEAIAGEWNAQGETIAPASLPLTKLANTAIDAVVGRKGQVAGDILRYAGTDLVCYRAEYPAELIAAQAAAWDPVLNWVRERYSAPFLVSAGIAHAEQPPASLAAIGAALARLDAFKLSALHVMTALTGSALIALAHAGGGLDVAAAWAAAHTDEDWQVAHWGEDYEASQRRKAQLAEFEAASLFFRLS
jgi:chaperone required for assembly of F1-ATPase